MSEDGQEFRQALQASPLIAILRGLTPEAAPAIGEALVEAGFRIIEVPLNSPKPFASIETMARRLGARALVGAGTVLSRQNVHDARNAGAKLMVSPNFDPGVMEEAKALGMALAPGVMTPSEAFAARTAGADALKLFPAEALSAKFVGALLAVLPNDVRLVPVGGVTPESMGEYWRAGARGFGIGSALFKPGKPLAEIARDAGAFVARARELRDGIGD